MTPLLDDFAMDRSNRRNRLSTDDSELAFSEHTLTTYRYTGLSGAWWHSGKKRPRPLEKSRWIPKSRPQVAYKAPKGFDAIKLHARARQNA